MFGSRFQEELTTCGLPEDPTKIVGRPFTFGDSSHVVVGTVTSIGYGSEEGIVLYVSPPRFRGVSIRRLRHVSGLVPNVWYVEPTEEKADQLVGSFTLL